VRVLLFSAVVTLAACGGSKASPTAPTPGASLPVLSVAVVDLSLLFDFQPFGFALVNPTYKFYTTGDTTSVRSAGPGTVVNILANPAPATDSEIHIRPPDAPDYLIIYDHVVALQVAIGQTVAAGQVIGRIAPWVPGKGFTELQVNRGAGTSTVALCPRQFGTAEFNAAHDAAIARFPSRGASVCLADTIRP
jgi:hypothetical protein